MAIRPAVALLLVAAVALTACASLSLATIDFNRVHLVDVSAPLNAQGLRNFLFRGNMPTNDTDKKHPTFAYDTLISYARTRASSVGITLPEQLWVVDVSLDWLYDGVDFTTEALYFVLNPTKGQFVDWPLGFAGILPPDIYSEYNRAHLANTSAIWRVDQLPTRIPALRQLLYKNFNNVSALIYVHCTAGCDRTGEVIGSYRMLYQGMNTTGMYAANTAECGRSPNYFSTGALSWFCYYLRDQFPSLSLGHCTDFARCLPFYHCIPNDGETDMTMDPSDAIAAVNAGRIAKLLSPEVLQHLATAEGLPLPADLLIRQLAGEAGLPQTAINQLLGTLQTFRNL